MWQNGLCWSGPEYDEGAFFILADEISRGDDRSLFDLAGGVYEMHPVLDSAYLSSSSHGA
jgi:hypothetical protein